jgi:hypothetical protein
MYGEIAKGFSLQVSTSCNSCDARSIEKALINAGISERTARAVCSSGNWKVERLK